MRPHHGPEGLAPDAPASHAAAGGLWGPFEMTLRGALDAPATARTTVAGWMAGHVDERTLADAQLVVGELVGNSVRHADTPDGAAVSVRLKIRGDAVHVEVQDGGTRGSITRRAPDLEDGGGFGLTLVEAIARRWGVARGAGTRVWAEIALATGARAAAVGPDAAGQERRRVAAVAALMRADTARRRASAAREARDRAITEYSRGSESRMADLHDAIARHHESLARRLRLRGADSDSDAA